MKSQRMGMVLAGAALVLGALACSAAGGGGEAPTITAPRSSGATATPRPSATPSPTPTPAVYSLQVEGPTTTQIQVRPEDYVWVMADGEIVLGFFAGSTGPGGKDSQLLSDYSTVPALPHGALLCRVKGGEWELCGWEAEFRPSASGALEFTVNDDDRSNNSGAFAVQVVISSYSARAQSEAQSAAETPAPTSDNPRDYLAGELTCDRLGANYSVFGSLVNKSARPIDLTMVLSVSDISGNSSFYESQVDTQRLPPGEETRLLFGSISLPWEDPNLPAPYYSCDITSRAEWGD